MLISAVKIDNFKKVNSLSQELIELLECASTSLFRSHGEWPLACPGKA
jgi:hypothetical protein